MTPYSILVVDDDEVERYMVVRALAAADGAGKPVIVEADSGEAAIEHLRAEPFGCIICDYRMGAVNGVEVLTFAREHQPEAVRILFTGYASPQIAKDAKEVAEVHEFLEKPMTTDELRVLLQTKVVDPYLRPLVAE